MEQIKTKLRRIGDSKGVIINSKVLYENNANLGDEFIVSADKKKIVLTKIKGK